MINLIVGSITALGFIVLVLWAVRPSFREWVELPKYKMLEDERRFSANRPDEKSGQSY
jgi:hypothetical protein